MARASLRDRFIRRAQFSDGRTRLNQRCIYIPPTGPGLLMGAVLLVMLLGSVNYNNSLGYVLTFLLGSIVLVSVLHTYRNLSGLEVKLKGSCTAFAGEPARFRLQLRNPGSLPRYALRLGSAQGLETGADLAPDEGAELELRVPTQQRGVLELGQVNLWTRFPLGLFKAQSFLDTPLQCLVYPRPGPARPLPAAQPAGTQLAAGAALGGTEDFTGFRAYVPGDSPRHVHWKAAARSEALVVKQFGGGAAVEYWLDWAALPGYDNEQRLSQLCRWVLDAHGANLRYGLRLPGTPPVDPANGNAHRDHCLALLARFPGQPAS